MLASWRRSALVKRLWKQRQRHETSGEIENQQDLEIRSLLNSLLKRLSETQLESLVLSVESKGGDNTTCIPLTKTMVKLGKKSLDVQTFFNGVFRWPHLLYDEAKEKDCSDIDPELERLIWCSYGDDDDDVVVDTVCCNPHHQTMVVTPKLPLLTKLGIKEGRETTDSGSSSTETGGSPSHHQPQPLTGDSLTPGGRHGNYWCVIAYWEHKRRTGRLYTVHHNNVNVFQTLAHGDGVCLSLLQNQEPETENVRRTREKIGLGVLLYKRDNQVWLYNRSEFPVFINSPTLDNPTSRTFSVHKLSTGYSMKIFDYSDSEILQRSRDDRPMEDGPYDPSAVRISFAKGWGVNYSRQFVTSCPCWLEILLRGSHNSS